MAPDGIANLTSDGSDLGSRRSVLRFMLPLGHTSPVARFGKVSCGRAGNRVLS
jgi:hypothetical protein